MKILFVDDLPDLVRLYVERLQRDGHEAALFSDMTGALNALQHQAGTGKPFDLLVIDLMLQRFEPRFSPEYRKISAALAQAHLPNIATGQALGLRLWNTPPPRTPYCYLSSHPTLWMRDLDNEFEGANEEELALLRMDRDEVTSATLSEALGKVLDLWKRKGWTK